MSDDNPFLTAEWHNIAMINYVVPPAVLEAYLPAGTTLDLWQGHCFVTVVGLLFENARILGYGIPLQRNFEEISLRFYVKQTVDGKNRRGVVSIKEIVPRFTIATVAKLAYNEKYVRRSTRHDMQYQNGKLSRVAYGWRNGEIWEGFDVVIAGDLALPQSGSVEAFTTEYCWGFTKQKDGATLAYKIAHEPWEVWPAEDAWFLCDTAKLYGEEIGQYLDAVPHSAFVAKGSRIILNKATRITAQTTKQLVQAVAGLK